MNQTTLPSAVRLALITAPLLAGCSAPRVALDIEQSGKPLGTITLELDHRRAPATAANFLRYTDEHYYNRTLIHRVTMGPRIYVLQGGGYELTPAGMEKGFSTQPNKPGQHPSIKLESANRLPNVRGTIAMARDTAPDTATSEFFINIRDNPKLNYAGPDHPGYCVFGRVVSGMDVIDRIAAIETRTNPDPELHGEKSQPLDPPVIKNARRVK